jgi:hypothetical protein
VRKNLKMSTTLDELLQSLESDASGVEKQASDSTTNSNTLPGEQNEMSKEAAYEYGRALARELVKRANQITENDRAIQDVQASQVLPVPEATNQPTNQPTNQQQQPHTRHQQEKNSTAVKRTTTLDSTEYKVLKITPQYDVYAKPTTAFNRNDSYR